MPPIVEFMRKTPCAGDKRIPGLAWRPGTMAKRYLHWVQTPMPAEYSLVDAP